MKKRLLKALLFILLAPVVSAFGAGDLVRNRLEEYVQKQFVADKDDMLQDLLAKYTKLTPALEEHVVDGVLYDFRGDPFVVVKSYKILAVETDTNGKVATAKIQYTRVARGENYMHKGSRHTRLVLEPETLEDVVLKLTLNKGKWLILDPGLPHVSCEALKRLFFEYQAEEKEREIRLNVQKVPGGYSDRIRNDYQGIYTLNCH